MPTPTEIDLRDHPASSSRAPWWSAARLPERWTPVLLGFVVALVALSFSLRVLRLEGADFEGLNSLERWFLVDREMGVPAWLSTVLLVACAAQLWGLAGDGRAGRSGRWTRHERLLAVAFAYLSLDELTEIHEQTMAPLQQGLGLDGVLKFAWVVVAVPLVGVLGLVMLGWVRALPRSTRWCVVACGALYVGGAAGVELLGSFLSSTTGEDTVLYAAVTTVEESFEMVALVLFLGTLVTLRAARRRDTVPVVVPGVVAVEGAAQVRR